MPSDSERTKILEMIAEGTISAQDGIKLLDALEETSVESPVQEDTAGFEIPEETMDSEIPDDFGMHADEVLETDAVYQPDAAPKPPDPEDMKKWKRFWVIPLWIGVGVTVIGGALMYSAFAASGIGFWFACAWFPFLIGVLLMAFAWGSRTAPWLHVRVHQRPGESPQKIAISFPLPIRLAGWGLRTFGHFIPNMEGVDLESLLKAIDESAKGGTPFFVDVNDEDGEHVQVFIG